MDSTRPAPPNQSQARGQGQNQGHSNRGYDGHPHQPQRDYQPSNNQQQRSNGHQSNPNQSQSHPGKNAGYQPQRGNPNDPRQQPPHAGNQGNHGNQSINRQPDNRHNDERSQARPSQPQPNNQRNPHSNRAAPQQNGYSSQTSNQRGPPPQNTQQSHGPNSPTRPHGDRDQAPPTGRESDGYNQRYPENQQRHGPPQSDNRQNQPYNRSGPGTNPGINKQGYPQNQQDSRQQSTTRPHPQQSNERGSNSQSRGQHQGQSQGQPHGQPRGQPKGQPQENPNNQSRGQPHGQSHGQPQGYSKGQPGQAQGQSRVQPQGQYREQHQGQPRGHPQGQSHGQPQGQPQGQSRGQPQGQPHDKRAAPGVHPGQYQSRTDLRDNKRHQNDPSQPHGNNRSRDRQPEYRNPPNDNKNDNRDPRHAPNGQNKDPMTRNEQYDQTKRPPVNQPPRGNDMHQSGSSYQVQNPQAPPRHSSKGAVQKYDSKDNHGYTNQAYKSDEVNRQSQDNKNQLGYSGSGAPPQQPKSPQYRSTTALNQPYQRASQLDPNDPLANPYSVPQDSAGAPQKKYGSMSALHIPKQPMNQQQSAHAPGSALNPTTPPPTYSNAQNLRQGHSMHELNVKTLPAQMPAQGQMQATQAKGQSQMHGQSPRGQGQSPRGQGQSPRSQGQSPRGQESEDRRRYEKRSSAVPTQPNAPSRATKRGRILSQQEQGHQSRPQSQGQNQGSSNPGQFDTRPPMRAQSVTDIHLNISMTTPTTTPGAPTNLHRPASVPNISSTVPSAPVSVNQNGGTNTQSVTALESRMLKMGGGKGIWRSPSALDLVLNSSPDGGSNLQRSKSLTSLVVANPRLARTASQMMLYEMQVEQGKIPRDHFQTMTLTIIASAIILPFTGFPILWFAIKNKDRWTADSWLKAMSMNNRLFWLSIGSIGLGIASWILFIIFLSVLI